MFASQVSAMLVGALVCFLLSLYLRRDGFKFLANLVLGCGLIFVGYMLTLM